MFTLQSYLLVAAGSAVGGVARHYCTGIVAARWGSAFPWGTLVVNVGGSFLIGLLAVWLAPGARGPFTGEARDLLMVGVLGGYTTFSAFSLQAFSLFTDGSWLRAGGYVLLSVGLCLAAVALGVLAARSLLPGPP